MICPHNVKKVYTVTQNSSDDECNEAVTMTKYTMLECQKEGCGAWQDGRCNYRGTQCRQFWRYLLMNKLTA